MNKKHLLLAAALLAASFAKAQVNVDINSIFNVTDQPVELNEPKAKIADGVVFIGDTRPAEKIEEGKYRGMRVQKLGRTYSVDGKAVRLNNALSFRRAPWGATKEHAVVLTAVPRSCMMQLKPTSDGKFTFEVFTKKPEAKLYVGILNGTSWKNLGELTYKLEDKKGTKAEPLTPMTLDYKYTAGDEIWIYGEGATSLLGLQFTGTIDKSFQGTEPVAASKAVSRANKK